MSSLVELIHTIRQRAPMYIGQRSISCLNAFLAGWIFAQQGRVEDVSVLEDFQEWVARKCGIQELRAWDRVILFHSQDEAQALETFFAWFDEFLTERS